MSRNDDEIRKLLRKDYWRSTLYFLDVDGDLEYKCENTKPEASQDDVYWKVTKYIYDVNKDLEDKRVSHGTVTGRAALFT